MVRLAHRDCGGTVVARTPFDRTVGPDSAQVWRANLGRTALECLACGSEIRHQGEIETEQ